MAILGPILRSNDSETRHLHPLLEVSRPGARKVEFAIFHEAIQTLQLEDEQLALKFERGHIGSINSIRPLLIVRKRPLWLWLVFGIFLVVLHCTASAFCFITIGRRMSADPSYGEMHCSRL